MRTNQELSSSNSKLARGAAFRYSAKMLSVLIETRNDEEGLARTLASLVGGVVEGMVREVIVCDLGSTDQTAKVAEHAGCRYLATGGIKAGIGVAKGDWLLLLEPGARLVEGWTDTVADHIGRLSTPARFAPTRGARQPLLRRLFGRRSPLAHGLVIARKQAAALAGTSDRKSVV